MRGNSGTSNLSRATGQCLAANFCFILSAFLWGIARPLGCQVQKLPTGTSGKKSRHLHIGRDTLEKSSLQCNVSLWIQHLAGCFLSKNLHRTGKGCSKHLGFLDSNYFELRGSHWAMPICELILLVKLQESIRIYKMVWHGLRRALFCSNISKLLLMAFCCWTSSIPCTEPSSCGQLKKSNQTSVSLLGDARSIYSYQIHNDLLLPCLGHLRHMWELELAKHGLTLL